MIKGIVPRKFRPVNWARFTVPRKNNVYARMTDGFNIYPEDIITENDLDFQSHVLHYMLVEDVGVLPPSRFYRIVKFELMVPAFVKGANRIDGEELVRMGGDRIIRSYNFNGWIWLDSFNGWTRDHTILTYYRANQQRAFERQSKEFVQ